MLELVGEKGEKRMKLQVCIMSNFQFVKFIDRFLEDITNLVSRGVLRPRA